MAFSFSILGSGSMGNCTLVRLNGNGASRHVLIDAGLSPRATAKRLSPLGLALDDIDDILFTHLDHDHCCPTWVKAASRHDMTLHVHRRQRSRMQRDGWSFERVSLFEDSVELAGIDATRIQSVPFAHDQLGTVGFVVEHAGARLGFATDLGRVPPWLYEVFVDLDALALESNYDRRMQIDSGRPAQLKKRIMGGSGHLSNDESLEAVLRIAERSDLRCIALLHLSRQCNCPMLVQKLYAHRAPHLAPLLTVSDQFEATPLLSVPAPKQRGERRPVPTAAQIELLPFFAAKSAPTVHGHA